MKDETVSCSLVFDDRMNRSEVDLSLHLKNVLFLND